ncbi:Unknown protein, partial [Striga hermonthica]
TIRKITTKTVQTAVGACSWETAAWLRVEELLTYGHVRCRKRRGLVSYHGGDRQGIRGPIFALSRERVSTSSLCILGYYLSETHTHSFSRFECFNVKPFGWLIFTLYGFRLTSLFPPDDHYWTRGGDDHRVEYAFSFPIFSFFLCFLCVFVFSYRVSLIFVSRFYFYRMNVRDYVLSPILFGQAMRTLLCFKCGGGIS